MAKKSQSIPTLDEQIQSRTDNLLRKEVLSVLWENAHLTLEELSATIKDKSALKILLSTPLRELAGVEAKVVAAPKNGVSAKGKNGVKKKTPTNGVAAKSTPAVDLDTFLKGKKKGEAFKTAEYTKAAKIIQQTALNHLNQSAAVKKEGKRRGMQWVIK